jgi:hypothetical protein
MVKKIPLIIILLIALASIATFMSYMFSSCNVRNGATADSFFEHKLIGGNAYQLSDGTNVSLWEGFPGKYYYKLENGTVLLDFNDSDHTMHAGGYNNLSAAAKLKVDEYYQSQAPLYSIPNALEAAYADYLSDKEDFKTHPLQREVYNSCENDWYLCQITELITPASSENYANEIDVKHLSVIFDKESGETVSPWELFNIPEEKAKKLMIDAMGDMYDKELLFKEIDKAEIQWYGDHMQIEFFAGAIPGMTMNHSAGISGENLIPYLDEKALPKTIE